MGLHPTCQNHGREAGWQPAPRPAFTLLELLLVIAVLGVLAGLAIPRSEPSLHDQVRSVARILATDLEYARCLAVANNSTYRVTFDILGNRYVLKHTGSNGALDKLPKSVFAAAGDPSDQYIVALDALPHVGPAVRLAGAASAGAAYQPVDSVEFGPLGQTTRSSPTMIWLAAGSGAQTRYISLSVNPVTGLVSLGSYGSSGPPATGI